MCPLFLGAPNKASSSQLEEQMINFILDVTSYLIDHLTTLLIIVVLCLVFLFLLGWDRYPPTSGE